jgi:voltage-gated potassium channel
MDNTRHLLISIILALTIIVVGTSGYMIIEGWGVEDALYMTVITVSTVGYGEVQPVDGPGRIFTIILVFFGVGFSLYVAGAIVQFMVEGSLRTILGRRRLDKKINRLRDHYIICGYGRIGRVLCNNLRTSPGVEMVAIEQSDELVAAMDEDQVLYLNADATDESCLIKAGIQHARALVAALATDTDNVFLVLTARQLNPDLFIVARASQSSSMSKLKAAGADSVESPYEMGAARMAQRILRPTVTSFLDLAFEHSRKDIQMEEIPVKDSSPLVDVMLKDSNIRQDYNLIIIAIKNRDGEMQFNPSFETVIRRGDTVIAVGQEANLQRLGKVMNGN